MPTHGNPSHASPGPTAAGPDTSRDVSAGPPCLLALRALGLGDFLTALPALRALARQRPEHRRYLAAPPSHAELLRLAALDWTLLPTTWPAVPPWPRDHPPDIAVNLHGRGPQSTLLLRTMHAEHLWAHSPGDTSGAPGPPWIEGIHDIDIWTRLLGHYGVQADGTDLLLPPPGRRSGDTSAGTATAVIHPGAASAARRWPEQRFASVARHLTARGYRVYLTGSANEREGALRIARAAGLPQRHALAGRTSISNLAALVHGSSLVVCGDTGVGHLATAYRTPSVVLFGPVSPALWGPRIDGDRHVCLWDGQTGDPHGHRPDPGLLRITTDDVMDAVDQLGRSRVPAARPGEPGGTRASATFARP